MEFKDLIDYCQAQALANTLESTEITVWRSMCRSYSKKFNTPLHLCLNGDIPMEDIMLAEFEDQLENFDEEKDLERILDRIYTLEDPSYESEKREDLQEFIEEAERQEEERLKAGKPIHKAMKDESTLKNDSEDEPIKSNLPTSGGINLSYLEKEENQFGDYED